MTRSDTDDAHADDETNADARIDPDADDETNADGETKADAGTDADGTDLQEFLILRELDDPISEEELAAAGETSGEVLAALREEGVDIRWVESEVLADDEGRVTGTFCRYRAESEAAIREHADRAGLPATRVARRGAPLDGESG
jgi:hypothetical protein